jgi:hypothetical protein
MRCNTSGRFTPLAFTRITTSPAPSVGAGRAPRRNTSGAP